MVGRISGDFTRVLKIWQNNINYKEREDTVDGRIPVKSTTGSRAHSMDSVCLASNFAGVMWGSGR